MLLVQSYHCLLISKPPLELFGGIRPDNGGGDRKEEKKKKEVDSRFLLHVERDPMHASSNQISMVYSTVTEGTGKKEGRPLYLFVGSFKSKRTI